MMFDELLETITFTQSIPTLSSSPEVLSLSNQSNEQNIVHYHGC